MRFLILLIVAAVFSTSLLASNGVQVFNADATGFYVRVTFNSYSFSPVIINGQLYNHVLANGTTPILSKGDPEMVKFVIPVAIPAPQALHVKWVSSSNITVTGLDIAPSKGSIKRTINPSDVSYTFSDIYKVSTSYPSSNTSMQSIYNIGDQDGQNIEVYPMQYNPIQHSITVCREIVLYVQYAQPFCLHSNTLHSNLTFEAIKQNHFYNYFTITPYIHNHPVNEEGDMLVITPDSFKTTMQPFIEWKRRRGIHVNTAVVNAKLRTTAQINAYIKNFYLKHNLAYVVLAGDAELLPVNIVRLSDGTNGTSDNIYGCVNGNDFYPDVIVGRFSAESKAQLQTQLIRSINYERDLDSTNAWIGYGLCLASQYGSGDNNEYDWQHERLIRKELLNYTYAHVQEQYDGTYKKDGLDTLYSDMPGNPSTVDFERKVNKGIGVINYTGHGTFDGINTSGTTNFDIGALTNTDMLPFCWIVGCQVGNFAGQTCFAEAGMRSTYSGKPAGWLAMLGSTVDQWWNEPMRAQDEFDTLLCQLKSYTKMSYGAISLSGELAMNDKYDYKGYDMTQTWVCFGDPSLLVRTETPLNMVVNHDKTRPLGTDSITVQCNTTGALVSLVQHDSIIATGIVEGNKALLHFDPILDTNSVYVTITALNRVTYNGYIRILAPQAAYIAAVSHTLDDYTGNNNNRPDYGEDIIVNMKITNIGLKGDSGIRIKVTSVDKYIHKLQVHNNYIHSIAATHSDKLYDVFTFSVADSVPDGYVATFVISATDSAGNTYVSNLHDTLLAPVLQIIGHKVEDTTGSNPWWISPGQAGLAGVQVVNSGHSAAVVKVTQAYCNNSYVTLSPRTATDTIYPNDTVWIKTPMSVSSTLTKNSHINLNITVADTPYLATTVWRYVIGRAVERFETGDFSLFKWLPTGDSNWFITNTMAYEGKYSARSGHINDYQSSTLSINVNATQDDTVFFAYKVSSQHRYDSLMFFIDSIMMFHCSGEVGWDIAALPVTKGNHTFQWTYAKDPFITVGQDCGWIDDIIFPAFASVPSGDIYMNSKKLDINISPNPASNFIDITVNSAEANLPVKISLYNSVGRPILTKFCNIPNYILDVSTLSTGIYFLQCAAKGTIHFEKIVVAR